MPQPFGNWPIGCLALCLFCSASKTVVTKTYHVRQRAFSYQPSSVIRDYQEEYSYIEQRRLSVVKGDSVYLKPYAYNRILFKRTRCSRHPGKSS